MIEKYIDVLFKAIEMRDMELIMFILSKDTSIDKLRKLRNIKNYKEGNVYEHLLLNKENDILRLFIDAGLLQIINEPINDKDELLLDLAYRYKNLPLILSLLSEPEVDLNIKTNGISFIDKVATTYSFENTILDHLKTTRPGLPIEEYKSKKTDCELLSKIVVDESAFPDGSDSQETLLDKIIPKEKQVLIKDGFANLGQSIKSKFSEINSSQNNKKDNIVQKDVPVVSKKEEELIKKELIEGELIEKVKSSPEKSIDDVEDIVIVEIKKEKK